MSNTLYEVDRDRWINETVYHLREQNFNNIDWDNLIEEIESMSRSDRRALLSLLTRLLEHLLKLSYWETEKTRSGNHWAAEIVNFRAQIQNQLEDSPSLRRQLEIMYDKAYPVAVKSVSKLFSLPDGAKVTLEQSLDDDWFPLEL